VLRDFPIDVVDTLRNLLLPVLLFGVLSRKKLKKTRALVMFSVVFYFVICKDLVIYERKSHFFLTYAEFSTSTLMIMMSTVLVTLLAIFFVLTRKFKSNSFLFFPLLFYVLLATKFIWHSDSVVESGVILFATISLFVFIFNFCSYSFFFNHSRSITYLCYSNIIRSHWTTKNHFHISKS
jgi:hypothetical protein